MTEHAPSPAVVLVPVKAFSLAKRRLSGHIDDDSRDRLARAMAEVVLRAAEPLVVVVVCDDAEVADWARERGAAVAWTPGMDLNQALTAALARVADSGLARAIIAHADLPFAHDLARFADVDDSTVVVVPDRHGQGTNVMSIPVPSSMDLSYGTDSMRAHVEAAAAADLTVSVVRDDALGWDVDEPADLEPPAHLGGLPVPV